MYKLLKYSSKFGIQFMKLQKNHKVQVLLFPDLQC